MRCNGPDYARWGPHSARTPAPEAGPVRPGGSRRAPSNRAVIVRKSGRRLRAPCYEAPPFGNAPSSPASRARPARLGAERPTQVFPRKLQERFNGIRGTRPIPAPRRRIEPDGRPGAARKPAFMRWKIGARMLRAAIVPRNEVALALDMSVDMLGPDRNGHRTAPRSPGAAGRPALPSSGGRRTAPGGRFLDARGRRGESRGGGFPIEGAGSDLREVAVEGAGRPGSEHRPAGTRRRVGERRAAAGGRDFPSVERSSHRRPFEERRTRVERQFAVRQRAVRLAVLARVADSAGVAACRVNLEPPGSPNQAAKRTRSSIVWPPKSGTGRSSNAAPSVATVALSRGAARTRPTTSAPRAFESGSMSSIACERSANSRQSAMAAARTASGVNGMRRRRRPVAS